MQLISFQITGDGATHTLASAVGINKCKWFQILNESGGTVNIGGPETSVGNGYPVAVQSGQFQPPIAIAMEEYDLAAIYYYISNLDTVRLLCAF
jgi:hypothetical protein